MPVFYLHVFDDVVAPDEEGYDLRDLEEAKGAAILAARELIAHHIMAGRLVHQSHRVEIANEAGQVLHAVRFGDVVRLEP